MSHIKCIFTLIFSLGLIFPLGASAQDLPEPRALADVLTGKAGAARGLPRSVIFRKSDQPGTGILAYRVRFAHDSAAIDAPAALFATSVSDSVLAAPRAKRASRRPSEP